MVSRLDEGGAEPRFAEPRLAEKRDSRAVDRDGRRVQRIESLLDERKRQRLPEQVRVKCLARRVTKRTRRNGPSVSRDQELEPLGPSHVRLAVGKEHTARPRRLVRRRPGLFDRVREAQRGAANETDFSQTRRVPSRVWKGPLTVQTKTVQMVRTCQRSA